MKVLFALGGITHYMDALLKKIASKGIEMVMVIPSKSAVIGEGVKLADDNNSYKKIIVEEKKKNYGKDALSSLPEIINKEKPDIFLIGWPYFLQLFFQASLRKAIKRNKVKLVIREIPFQVPPFGKIKSYFRKNPMYDENMNLKSKGLSFYIRQLFTMYIRKYCYSLADATLNYSTVAYNILPTYGVKKENIHVTFNTSDTDALWNVEKQLEKSSPLLPANNYRLLHIGRLVKWKRVDLIIKAIKKIILEFDNLELIIIGNGPEKDNLIKQALDLGLEKNILFVGGVYEPEKLGAYMKESSIYILAGMGGLSINDAMTYGMPVICSVCDSTEKDLIYNDKNGYFFKEGDVNDLAEKIKLILSSPERCSEMGKESRKIIEEKINLETVSNNYVQAFNKIINTPSLS